ncbi:hypothetical protein AB8880_06360 [Alphaproteobacteria bacterium LSUCC0684]
MFATTISAEQLNQGKPVNLALEADRPACRELAERFGWIEVCSLRAELRLKSVAKTVYQVTGQIEAAIIQSCRLSGNPVPEALLITVNERFADLEKEAGDTEIDPMAVSVEALEDGKIPIGEMIAQLVGLEATPWPRDPGVADEGILPAGEDPDHPFASLAQMKKNL